MDPIGNLLRLGWVSRGWHATTQWSRTWDFSRRRQRFRTNPMHAGPKLQSPQIFNTKPPQVQHLLQEPPRGCRASVLAPIPQCARTPAVHATFGLGRQLALGWRLGEDRDLSTEAHSFPDFENGANLRPVLTHNHIWRTQICNKKRGETFDPTGRSVPGPA